MILEKRIPDTQMVGLRALLHHQYPPLVWYHRMPPFDISQPTRPPPPVAGKLGQWASGARHSRQNHSRQQLIPSLIMAPKNGPCGG